jgi:hypothetical protein
MVIIGVRCVPEIWGGVSMYRTAGRLRDATSAKSSDKTEKPSPPRPLVPVASTNFESDTFSFPLLEPRSVSHVTVVDLATGSIRFSILRS